MKNNVAASMVKQIDSNNLSYNNYKGSFEWDSDASIYHGRLNNIKDVVTFEGETIEEIKSAFIYSIIDYIDMCNSECN